jgi:predicted component of type VI protein secretion system
VTGEDLGSLLSEYDQTRLVVLNACEGARNDASDPFAGVAQSLIQQALPAVIAMQFESPTTWRSSSPVSCTQRSPRAITDRDQITVRLNRRIYSPVLRQASLPENDYCPLVGRPHPPLRVRLT